MNRWRPLTWLVLLTAGFIAVALFLRSGHKRQAQNAAAPAIPAAANTAVPASSSAPEEGAMTADSVKSASTAPIAELRPQATNSVTVKHTNSFPYRLTNTKQTVGELARNSHAILLENALIDSSDSSALTIPDALKSHGDPGAYIVQADGPIGPAFRQQLVADGATIISYIPNNAYLVRASTGTAQSLRQFANVTPWEPYFKVKTALMKTALAGGGAGALNIAVFPDAVEATVAALAQMDVEVASQSRSPFGMEFAIRNVGNIAAVASLPGVEEVEPSLARVSANDLTRVIMNDAADVFTPTNYLNLSGSNVIVAVPDSWVPTNGLTQFNPDLLNITSPFPGVNDFAGHATHVGGIIASSGLNGPGTNVFGSQPGANFRGKAPLATLFALPAQTPIFTDGELQEYTATNKALISNNSWGYDTSDYNLAAASYDQAVRDSLPGASGSQQIIYVFAAGNNGQGADDGTGGVADTVASPATSKNSITVGASELPRNITNDVSQCDLCDQPVPSCFTNQPWQGMTDSSNQVARFSSRGNVGIGVEGDFGRFKPDLVAPGTFVVSTRSMTWDTNAYYSPVTIDTHQFLNQNLNHRTITNVSVNYPVLIPCDAFQFDITALSTRPTNLDLSIYVKPEAPPQPPADLQGTNFVSIPNTTLSLTPVDTLWYFRVGADTNIQVNYNVTAQVYRTNEMGDYWDVLRTNLNDLLITTNVGANFGKVLYRYEFGTSMAAPAVAGTLALMEDYFTNQLHYTPSPALMKALLINGARSLNPIYDFQVQNDINYQGWGLVNLTNSLPIGITNANTMGAASAPMIYMDQSLSNSLATGDSRTFTFSVDENAIFDPIRITLVWTDPPGNPAAGIKLVNNLDLVVTNNDGTTNPPIYFGNNFPAGIQYTSRWDRNTNNPVPSDNVNNVENVYLPAVQGTNYSITVVARSVNVNAVTSHTNGVVQDFALVISSANGDFTNALTLVSTAIGPTNYAADLTGITNQFPDSPDTSGGLLTGQHVGASSPLQGTNGLSLGGVVQNNWGNNGEITLGVSNQWHFYVVTNIMGTNATVSFTNAVFGTFLPSTLSIPPVGVNAPNDADSTRPESDIDLYVARGPSAWGLTNLDPTVIATADKSLGREGTEFIVYSNAQPNEVFYIGVKSEDQEASEYDFLALFSEFPFSTMGPNGEEYLHGINVPTIIPDGTPNKPGVAMTIALAVQPIEVRRVVVTNIMEHENFGDLLGTLSHNRIPVVLNNHTFGNGATNQAFIYDDSGEGDEPGAGPTDGPGSLQDFTGQQGLGLWMLQEVDNSLFNTGRVDNVFIRLDPQAGTNGVVADIAPDTFFYDFIDVPPEATNMTVCVNFIPPSVGPVQLYIRYGEQPTLTRYDYTEVINNPGDCLTVGRTDLPPLKPGRYYVGIFNPTAITQTVRLTWSFGLDPNGANPTPITSAPGTVQLPDDAVTNSTIFITNNQNIVTVNVGVVLEHPRISDLDLTLVSPTGQRILLFENRGGVSATNMGHLNITTNFFGSTAAGAATSVTNFLAPVLNAGTLIIDYDFAQIPDRIDVYYDNLDIFSTTTAGAGTFTIPYGPGTDTSIAIVMNQGNNSDPDTKWTYTPRVVSQDYTYLTFTDDTNLTQMPIKFALPPYDSPADGSNTVISDFELATNNEYFAPNTNIFDLLGGWGMTTNDVFVRTNYFAGTNLLSMATNEVSVVTDPGVAASGSNYLALANGSISRSIALTPGKKYTLTYLYRGPGIAGWWRGEGNATDSADPENLGNNGSLVGRFNFPAGEVGQAFAMEDSGLAFQFAGTNTYVQVRQARSLDVGEGSGFTVEGWINPTNITFQQPLVEWLARVPTNTVVNGQAISNLVVSAGPFLNRETGHYYYLIGPTNWTTSELWANALGGHLAEIDDANEDNWIYDTFAQFGGGTNYNMWIGLTNSSVNTNFFWSTGASNIVYTNWAFGQPTNCPTSHYTAINGPTNALPGLWKLLDNNGLTCGGAPTNKPFGVVEVNEIQTNGVQFWISVTNAANPGNGRLYANIYDTNGIPHEIFSPAGLIQSNVYQHVALTYNTNTGVATLYYSGTNVASTNLGVFVPKTGGDVLLGKDMSRATNNFFWGRMDEMSIYSRFLSPAEIAAIYRISANTTNRNIGKFDPAITPAESLAEAQVSFNGTTNVIFGRNQGWQVQGFSLRASSATVPLQFTGLEPGILLDSFNLSEPSLGNLYYLPEQPLQALVGSNAFGAWTLEIRDARTGTISTNADLISWQLQFILQTNIAPPIQLDPQTPGTNTVPPGQIAYFTVFVPAWANVANNMLVSATAPVDLLFNQTTPPGTGSPNDVTFVNNSTTGNQIISANPPTTPPLLPGRTYYLGVRNNGTVSSTVAVEVDFDITTLTNDVVLTSILNTNDLERPFVFNVASNATEATFQLLKLNGNADLVVRKGLPIPNLLSADYGSFAGSNADETIYVLTNSLPVPLSAGPWYLDVIKRDSAADLTASNIVRYSILAKQLTNLPGIINLSNRVPVNFTAGPGAALTNFFKFSVTNFPLSAVTNLGLHFELFSQTGDGDLTVQTNTFPLAPPFLQSSRLSGNNAEVIFIHTNSAFTNLNADWYLGVPNNETNAISFTILAEFDTNGIAAFPTAEGAGASTRGGGLGTNVYHVTNLEDSGPGSLRAAVTQTNGPETVVFDVAGTINLLSPLYITNSFMTIAGQTAPGSGITVVGAPSYVQNVHDMILRYLRFRPMVGGDPDSLQFNNVSDVIADHISAAFGTRDNISVLNSSNVTVQWSVLAESRNTTNISSGGSEVRFGSGDVTLHHNLYADNYSGNPTIGEDISLDFVNNVIYNWGIFAGFSTNDLAGNPDGLTNFLNYSANYLIAGTNSVFTNVAFWGGTPDTWIFQTNNFVDTNRNAILDGANTSWGMFSNQFTEFSHAFPIPPTAPDEAFIAYERVLDFAGAAMDKRDSTDQRIVLNVRRLASANAPSGPSLSGIVSWWPGEGNAKDFVGGNNGTLQGNVNYAPGEVCQAFSLNDANSYVKIPASATLNIGLSNGFTLEAWVNPSDVSDFHPIFEWNNGIGAGVHFYISASVGPGSLFANIGDIGGGSHSFASTSAPVRTNVFQHVALTYDKNSGVACLYYNGALIGQQTLGTFTPLTTYDLYLGKRLAAPPPYGYIGLIDEPSIYGRALSQAEILAIVSAGKVGKKPPVSTNTNTTPYVDVDKDGIPDFWEITLGEKATNFSPNLDRDGDGYTDLEEYMNWLGVPHAVTVTNTQTDIDLYVLSGNTGRLLFGVTNGTNGTVYLTNQMNECGTVLRSNNIAVFTPAPVFLNGSNSGYASFSYMVTNTDTMAHFGPVTVSMFVSAVPITNVPPVSFIFTNPPDVTMDELTTVTVTNAANTNNIIYTLVDPPTWVTIDPVTGIISLSPLEVDGPTNVVITTLATDSSVPPVTLQNTFTVTVNEINVAPFWPTNVPSQTNYTVPALDTLIVTNTAMDSDIPVNPLTYQLFITPPVGNATISTNGIIMWTPTEAQVGVYIFTTVVTDTNPPADATSLSNTNVFTVTVTPTLPPLAFTQPAQSVTGTSAQLNGMATPNGLPTLAWFEWGTNTIYGNQTPSQAIGNSLNVVFTTSQIIGLLTNVPYHYRLVVSNALGTTVGFDQVFDEANVVVWGANYLQQSVPPTGSNFTAIAGAYDHSLALRTDGRVVAWGDDTANQTNVPPGLNNIAAVAGGQYSSLALRNSRMVAAWGGSIGNVTNVPAGLNNVVMIAGGTYASLALQSSGLIVPWGTSFSGETNLPPGLSNVVEIASGSFHGLAIKNDGTVVSWGDNSEGQTNVPAGLSNIVAVAGGNFHSLALTFDGQVVAWGFNNNGQTQVPAGLTNVVAIAAGGYHSMALKSDGTLVEWGDDSLGQTSFPHGLSNVVAIAAGNFHSIALTPTLPPTSLILPLTNGVPETNSILRGTIVYYQVDVPPNADAATNALLLTLNGALNVWYSTNTPPTITNANDFLLITNALSGTSVVTTATSPQLIPGTTYYLGVENTNNFTVSYAIGVDFHLLPGGPLTNTIPITSITRTNVNGTNGFLLVWFAPTNDLFLVQWSPTLFAPTWSSFTNIVGVHTILDPTNGEFEFFDDGSQTGGFLDPSRYYQLILLNGGAIPPVLPPDAPATNSVPSGEVTFYQVNVPTNADFATNVLLSANAPVNLWFSPNSPPSITNVNDLLFITNAASGSFTLSTTGSPPLIPGGTYYLGVQNTNAFTVTNVLQVSFHLAAGGGTAPETNTIPISTITVTNRDGTNGVLMVWYAPTNALFQVQWSPSLFPTSWHTFTNIIAYHTFIDPTNSEFEFFDDGSQSGPAPKFYQLILLGSAGGSSAIPVLDEGVSTSNSVPVGGVQFYRVNVPTNADFATNLLLSAAAPLNIWFSTNNPPTITNGDDVLLLTNATIGSFTLGTTGSPLLVPGGTYYLGVQNTNGSAAIYSLEVNFHRVTAGAETNTIPISTITVTNRDGTNGVLMVWYAPTNALFQVQWSPSLFPTSWHTFTNIIAYHTFIDPTNSEFEFFDDGSQSGPAPKFYQLILLNSGGASLPSSPSAIALSNGVPMNFTTGAGSTNFFSFDITQTNAAVLFELYNLSGNGDLTVQRSNLPVTPPYASSTMSGTNAEQIVIRTNIGMPNINAISWFLGVPNQSASSITYTIRAVIPTNGILVSGLPINTLPSVLGGSNIQLTWGPTVDGEKYEVRTNANLASPNWVALTDIVAIGTSATFVAPAPVGSTPLFYQIVQVP